MSAIIDGYNLSGKKEDFDIYVRYLQRHKVPSIFWGINHLPKEFEYPKKFEYLTARDYKCLDRLLHAYKISWSREALGLALGYPEEAVFSFCKIRNGERRDGTSYLVSLAKAKQAGIEIPTWLAYIGFIPEQLDLVNNNISSSTKALGEEYQKFVRKHNPHLAQRVEDYFLHRQLPDRWEKRDDGSYTLIFPPKPPR